jgi:proline iminopeptidase
MINRRNFSKLLISNSLLMQSSLLFAADKVAQSSIPDPEESGYIPTPNGRIWYRINGKEHFSAGKTPLVCLHGGPGSSHHYLLPLLDLAKDRPVILYDQLDCGLADRPNVKKNWTVKRFVAEIDILRDALNLSEIALYGNSCGSTWIAPYAAKKTTSFHQASLPIN